MNIVFDRENIVPGIPGILLLSHGPLAIATIESARLIVGEMPNVAAFCLDPEDSVEEYVRLFCEAHEMLPGKVIALVDIYGGTPCNQLTLLALRSGNNPLALAGLSLPMFLEACDLRKEETGEQLIRDLQETSKNEIVCVSEKLSDYEKVQKQL